MEIRHSLIIFKLLCYLSLINYYSTQILIHSNNMEGPSIITRQTFTVRSNDGTPITITKINIHSGRNINSGNDKLTPFDLMRIMDSRVNDFFEEIIRRQISFFNAIEQEEEKENNGNQKDSKNTLDDKEFELDEGKEDNKNISDIDKNKNIKNDDHKKEKEKNKNKHIKKIGKLTINEDNIKNNNNNNNNKTIKKKGKKLTKKEIIFSRVCKYIFYSIILFTIYILIKKLLEILDIIDPESSEKNVDINIKNIENKNEETKEKVESEVIVNKERENKQN